MIPTCVVLTDQPVVCIECTNSRGNMMSGSGEYEVAVVQIEVTVLCPLFEWPGQANNHRQIAAGQREIRSGKLLSSMALIFKL